MPLTLLLVSPWHQKPDPLWYVSRRNAKGRNPGRFREEKREGETAQKPFPSKHRNPGRSGKFPGRETGREKPTIKKPAVREDPGSIREEKREEM